MRNPDIVQKTSSREAGILSDEEMDDNVMEVENSEEENEVDTKIEDFEVTMDDFKKEVSKRICEDAHSYTKCVKSFTKQLRLITHSRHRLQNHVDCINVEVAKVPGKADLQKI